MTATPYPKRLIEVDLPIKEVSTQARREKSIRQGHLSTLHLWWARRPLAACRAVLCASLWPDPADEHCPRAFRDAAAAILGDFAEKVRSDKQLAELCAAQWSRWRTIDANRLRVDETAARLDMRQALLDFIAAFANWDAANNPAFVDAARRLTQAASPNGRPVVVDPFAGGGSIPYEAARLGSEAFASDLNPVAVTLNKVSLDLVPRFGARLAEAVRRVGAEVNDRAAEELGTFYPAVADTRAAPAAYLWARTIRCEGPSCGAEIPLLRSLWLGRRPSRMVALKVLADIVTKQISFAVVDGKKVTVGSGTTAGGKATCPICGFTTQNESVRRQLVERRGGSASARMFLVVETVRGESGRNYRVPQAADLDAATRAAAKLRQIVAESPGRSILPDEPIPHEAVWKNNPIRVHLYGMKTWGDLFHPRQALGLATLIRIAADATAAMPDRELADATRICLGLAINRVVEKCSSLARWDSSPTKETLAGTFGRQALPMVWDFAELVPFRDIAGSFENSVEWVGGFLEGTARAGLWPGHVTLASATSHPLSDDSADAVVTDPPYYDAVPYAKLSNYFYVWLKRSIGDVLPDLFSKLLCDGEDECVVDDALGKDRKYFEATMAKALTEARRVLRPDGIGVVVFAHKSTVGWEAQLSAMLDAGWTITASWPIDTEMGNRLRAMGAAALASSVHLVCRPREAVAGQTGVGAWRDILSELPVRIHDWMPRLAHEGVVGADAIFACLGPALEVFSRYSRVEKASGEAVPLREYLEQVWAAVAREALSMMFEGADASGLEEDARLTAMWLWTLGAGSSGGNGAPTVEGDGDEGGEEEDEGTEKMLSGFVLEFDAARKIAQGLGAHLEKLTDVVEVKGDKARLLAVAERAKSLFSKDANSSDETPVKGKAKPSKKQLGLFAEIEVAEKEGLLGKGGIPKVGETTLDRVHQSMILFGAGRSEALKRFVVEEGVGKDGRFWKLAQSLSALYPAGSDEKRWVDGVLARKKGLGF